MAIKYLSHLETLNIDLQGNQLLNAVVHPDTTANRPAAPGTGQLFFNTSTSQLEIWDGSAWTSASGDITAVGASDGLTGGGTAGSVSLAVDYSTSSTNVVSAAPVGSPAITSTVLFSDTGGVNKVRFDKIPLSLFDNDANFSSTTGTVTSVAASGSGGVTISGSPITTSGTIAIGLSNVPNSSLANSSVTINAGKGLQDGGAVALGGSTTLNVDYLGADNVILAAANSAGTPVQPDWAVLISSGDSGNAESFLVGDLPFAPSGTVSGVTSVAATGSGGITVSGSPITSTGTLALGLSNVPNSSLANDDVTFGSTTVALGGTSTSIAGLTGLDFAAGNRSIGASIGAHSLTVGGAASTVVIAGNLTVSGTTTTVDSNTVNIGDNIIVLNADETGTPSQDGGIEIERGTEPNVAFVWSEGNQYWTTGNTLLAAKSFIGDLNGNAATASKWLNARTITLSGDASGSVSIDGSADVTLSVTVDGVQANSVALGTDTTGDYVAGVTGSGAISVTGSGGEGSTPAISVANASDSAKGVVELATSQEAITGTDTARAVTPKAASDLVADRQAKVRVNDVIPAGAQTQGIFHGFGSTFGVVAGAVSPIIVSYFDTVTGEQLMIDTVQTTVDGIEARLAAPHANDIFVSIMYAGA